MLKFTKSETVELNEVDRNDVKLKTNNEETLVVFKMGQGFIEYNLLGLDKPKHYGCGQLFPGDSIIIPANIKYRIYRYNVGCDCVYDIYKLSDK